MVTSLTPGGGVGDTQDARGVEQCLMYPALAGSAEALELPTLEACMRSKPKGALGSALDLFGLA